MQHKKYYSKRYHYLTKLGKRCKLLAQRICNLLSLKGNRQFFLEMRPYCNIYEGHIIDTGKDELNEEIGLIFWGGFFSRKKYKDAESKAWISLIEDCIGISEVKDFHNLTRSLEIWYGPNINFNFKTIDELESFLDKQQL